MKSTLQIAGPEPLSLGQLLAPLGWHWRAVVLATAIGLAAALLLAFYQDPVYRATTLLELQGINDDFLNLKDLTPAANETSLDPYLQTQIKIIQSPELLGRVADKLKLASREEFNTPQSWSTRLLRTAASDGREQLLRELSRHLTIRLAGQSRVIEVVAESKDPKLASNLANTVSQEYIEYTLARRVSNSRNTSEWLGGQMGDLKANLERSEDAVQRYARQEGLLFTSENNNVAEAKLQQLQEALSKAQEARIQEQARYGRVASSAPDALPEVLDDSTLRSYQVKLTDLKRQRAQLSSTLMPEHYKVQEVTAQIAELEAALNRGRASVLARIRNQYTAAQQREKLQASAYAAQAALVAQQSAKSVQYKNLKQEADSNRRLYESMLQKVKETGIASAVRATNVQLLNAATVPGIPAKPSLPLYTVVGIMVGLFAGMTWVFARGDRAAHTRTPGETGIFPGYPELGAIPYAREIACGEESEMTEAVRSTLASMLVSVPAGEQPRVVAITSASAGEGKTTLAGNLAVALAETRQSVVLVDGHLRQPRLHNLFHLPNTEGLGELLGESGSRLRHRVAEHCVPTGVEGLHLLPAGEGAPGVVNRLFSPRLAQIFDCLRDQFDVVIVDTAPLSLLDSRPLARMADGVVLVAGSRCTARESVQAALRQLTEDGTVVLGTVRNDCGPKKSPARATVRLAFPIPESSYRLS